jgi:mRNA interferase MazF
LDPVQGSEIAKTRPCVVMSKELINEHRRTVVVVPLSSSPTAAPPLRIPVVCNGRPAVAATDQIRAVSKLRLGGHMGRLSHEELDAIADGLKVVLEMG